MRGTWSEKTVRAATRRFEREEALDPAEEDEALLCYANCSSEERADFSGGIKTTIEGDFETEFFQIDSASRPDSAI